MTISTKYSPDTYSGDGSNDTFAITFEFLNISSFIKVSIKVDSTGVITEKTASTHYNVSGSNVVFTSGNIPTSGQTVVIELNPDFAQSSDYAENSRLPAETLERDLDERTLESQINNDLINRAIRIDSSEDISSATLSVGFPATGSEVISLSSTGEITTTNVASLGAVTIPVEINQGGTNATTVSAARTNLDVQQDLDNYTATVATVATNDKVLIKDTDDSDSLKYVTASSIAALSSGGISNVVEDTTPQLGGDLDLNGNSLDFPTTPNISDVLDEDDMVSNSATALATQQSIKAYVDASSGGLSAASQADQETGTSNTVAVTPGRQQYHQSAAKCWVKFTSVTTTTINASYNVTSLSDGGSGRTTVNIATNFSTGDYAVAGMSYENSANVNNNLSIQNGTTPAAGSVSVVSQSNGTRTDMPLCSLVIFGDQ